MQVNTHHALEEFLIYLRDAKNRSPGTLITYRSVLSSFFYSKKLSKLSQITHLIAEEYMIERRQGKHSRKPQVDINTNVTFITALRTFLRFCNRRSYTEANLELYERPQKKKTHVEYFTPEEINQMVLACRKERDRLIMLTLFTSGCRVSELVQMTVENIRDNKFSVLTKGSEPRTYLFDRVIAERLKLYCYVEQIASGHVWIAPDGKPLSRQAINYLIKRYAKLAGLKKSGHTHMTRHGFGTASLENGVDLRTLQELMGHTSITSTQIYTHVTDKRKEESHDTYAPKVLTPLAYSDSIRASSKNNG